MISVESMRIKRLVAEAEALDRVNLPPFRGSALRGVFGKTFRQIVCVAKRSECSGCGLRDRCGYCYMFETPPPASAEMMRKYPTAPHPFVLEPPERGMFQPGDRMIFSVVLVGKGIDLMPQTVCALMLAGEAGLGRSRGRYRVLSVRSVSGESIYQPGRLDCGSADDREFILNRLNSLGSRRRIGIRFVTPTRLKYEGALAVSGEFHVLLRNLLRRVSALHYFHCGNRLLHDFKSLVEDSMRVKTTDCKLRWVDLERRSARQGTTMKLGGFVGYALYEGEITRFLPYLVLGEQIHVGKGATFGLGKYQII